MLTHISANRLNKLYFLKTNIKYSKSYRVSLEIFIIFSTNFSAISSSLLFELIHLSTMYAPIHNICETDVLKLSEVGTF